MLKMTKRRPRQVVHQGLGDSRADDNSSSGRFGGRSQKKRGTQRLEVHAPEHFVASVDFGFLRVVRHHTNATTRLRPRDADGAAGRAAESTSYTLDGADLCLM